MPDPYAVDARFYDLIHRDAPDDDTGLWLSFAGRTDRPVLEVGCGTGRITLALARAGFRVTGVDPSPAMLAVADERADAEGLDLALIAGRVQDLDLEAGHYGFALVPADVFLYCEDGEEQLELLAALGRALHFNGTLAVDLPGPALWLDESTNGQPLLVFSEDHDDGSTFDAWHTHEDDLAQQVRELRVTYEETAADGTVRRSLSRHRLRYVYRFEMEYLLHLAGLVLTGVYGDYDLDPLRGGSDRMIFTARPAQP